MSDDLANNAVIAVTAFYSEQVTRLKGQLNEREKFWRSELAKSSALNGNLASRLATSSGKTVAEVLDEAQRRNAVPVPNPPEARRDPNHGDKPDPILDADKT